VNTKKNFRHYEGERRVAEENMAKRQLEKGTREFGEGGGSRDRKEKKYCLRKSRPKVETLFCHRKGGKLLLVWRSTSIEMGRRKRKRTVLLQKRTSMPSGEADGLEKKQKSSPATGERVPFICQRGTKRGRSIRRKVSSCIDDYWINFRTKRGKSKREQCKRNIEESYLYNQERGERV